VRRGGRARTCPGGRSLGDRVGPRGWRIHRSAAARDAQEDRCSRPDLIPGANAWPEKSPRRATTGWTILLDSGPPSGCRMWWSRPGLAFPWDGHFGWHRQVSGLNGRFWRFESARAPQICRGTIVAVSRQARALQGGLGNGFPAACQHDVHRDEDPSRCRRTGLRPTRIPAAGADSK
jgi:hypothetical protein